MKTSLPVAALAALMCLAVPALALAKGPSVVKKEGVGAVLVDDAGMTLYTFKKDAPGQSNCAGECLAKWPAYLGEGAGASELKASDLGTITRADGAKQTTYKGMPLYTFVADKSPADAKGQGVKDVWYVATP